MTSWFVKKCLPCAGIPEKRRTTDEIRLWKARVGRNGALPAGNGRIGRVRGMHMGQRTGGSTMTAGSVIVLAFWVIFTVRKHFTPKLAAAEKANTYDLNRDNPEAKRAAQRRRGPLAAARWALRVAGWAENVLAVLMIAWLAFLLGAILTGTFFVFGYPV